MLSFCIILLAKTIYRVQLSTVAWRNILLPFCGKNYKVVWQNAGIWEQGKNWET